MFTASGLLVRFLKVYERSGYQSVKWVRYLTRAQGTYQIRVSTPGYDLSWCTDVLSPVLEIWDFFLPVYLPPLGRYVGKLS
jgi:Adaptor complexes medium subunit family